MQQGGVSSSPRAIQQLDASPACDDISAIASILEDMPVSYVSRLLAQVKIDQAQFSKRGNQKQQERLVLASSPPPSPLPSHLSPAPDATLSSLTVISGAPPSDSSDDFPFPLLPDVSSLNILFRLLSGLASTDVTSMSVVVPPSLRLRPLPSLSLPDAEAVGKAFAQHLLTNSNPEAAVDEFVLEYRCMEMLDGRCREFRPMLTQIATNAFRKSAFGMYFKLFFGAGLSMGDMASDIGMIVKFLQGGQSGFAFALLACILTNMTMQAAMLLLISGKKQKREIARELFFLITCLAPGVDAYRLASGQEKDVTDVIGHDAVLWIRKMQEICFEAVPGLCIQLYAALWFFQEVSSLSVLSLTLSTATTSFAVCQMFVDKDTSPRGRSLNPAFYGAVPNGFFARIACLLTMMVFTMCHTFSRCLGLALLWHTFGGSIAAGAWVAEFVVLILVKAVRGRDLIYWLPVKSFSASLVWSIFPRLVTKILVDFTGSLQQRHAYELGGMTFSLLLVWAQTGSIISAVLYLEFYVPVDGRMKIDARSMYGVVGGLIVTWAVMFAAFLRQINPGYTRTFFSAEQGYDFTVRMFREGNELQKSNIFSKNFWHWSGSKGEVREWTMKNWSRWKAEKPDWFTEHWISIVPDDFIPKEDLLAGRRKSSLLQDLIDGAVPAEGVGRVSMRRASGKVAHAPGV